MEGKKEEKEGRKKWKRRRVTLMSMLPNNALLRGGVRVRAWIREQRKIKRRSEALLCL